MDKDNKKQNYSSRTGNTRTSNQTTDSNCQKSSSDIQTNKHWPKNSRRRENPSTSARNNNNSNSKQQQSAKVRPNVDKRPRARGYNGYNNNNSGGSYRGSNENHFTTGTGLGYGDTTFYGAAVERFEPNDYELNSIYAPGSKKQNLNHLLNFYYTPREVDYYDGVNSAGNGGSGNGYNQRHGHVKRHKYNKEQFLQANFQFVIKSSAKRKTDDSPDTLIDWSLIEQINIQTPDEPQCPICLYPPVAAKVTRCGHVYCWPCVLHYLSLSDKTWRKCPICYDAIHVGDLKSASIVQQQAFNANSRITFRLMRRKKGSLFIEQYDGDKNEENIEKYPYVSSPLKEKLFSKFILAKRSDVADILSREQRELLTDVDESCPEYVFIQQALELLKERTELLGDIELKDEEKYKSEEIAENIEEKGKFEVTAQEGLINDNISNIEHAELQANNELKETEEATDSNNEALNKQEINAEEETSETSSNTDTISYTQTACAQKSSPNKFYYFYQSEDGQNIYLHPLNVKMLQACYGTLADAPPVISARIIQKEQHSMDEDHRRKFTCLGHLPLTCQFAVVEIELQPPYVTEDIIQAFKGDILFRKKERQRRAREEREREKHINAINERQMGKLVASTANINITSSHEFPTCGFEESLVPASDLDMTDNVPSTSKGGRTKTVSTSSAGSCSYSAIAIHCKKEHTPWANLNAAQMKPTLAAAAGNQLTTDDGETSILNTIQTNLGDVLAQALSQKKERKCTTKANESTNNNNSNATGGNKKSKKTKKMLPLYSTGMNFGGNN
ncbi:RING finger protein 10 [Lucilia sericata]|uniref:RING finger protein 10 n=1 Tax=Lucilia sericata TaxID=13632 RepID=UPI0018A80375|nr:RING finger protein 10 [Lucilia sericata]